MLFNRYEKINALSHSAKMASFDNISVLLRNTSLAADYEVAPKLDSLITGEGYETAYALAYAGHQFGHYSPLLGDGRAHYLGSLDSTHGSFDVQLKGSGATSFSRGGDGFCAIGPAIREYVMSEALHALKVPTTRCLGVALTGENVFRNEHKAGAVVSRLASSHIRIGSFQFLAAQEEQEALSGLVELAIERHYPQLKSLSGDEQLLAFVDAVMEKQIALVVQWMRVGFIHGVMNTDNVLISGETIDYGPCAMLDQFDYNQVFSSIDRQGRYAFGNQPQIANWNLARFAESLISLFSVPQEQAVELLTQQLKGFGDRFNNALKAMWMQKLGLLNSDNHLDELINELLITMQEQQLDYTNTFAALTASIAQQASALNIDGSLEKWVAKWRDVVEGHKAQSAQMMAEANPKVIPRNHQVEQVISEFEETGESALFPTLMAALSEPYELAAEHEFLQKPPHSNEHYQTFCGT